MRTTTARAPRPAVLQFAFLGARERPQKTVINIHQSEK